MGGHSVSAEPGAKQIRNVTPSQAWEILDKNPDAALIDVRTQAEWNFVGVPDLGAVGKSAFFAEWSSFPGMSKNPRFVEAVTEHFGPTAAGPLLFLCRSGGRSMQAAIEVQAHYRSLGAQLECINVAEGFEGDLDTRKHRGTTNGWQARGLGWHQS